jgi:hypothetical protein
LALPDLGLNFNVSDSMLGRRNYRDNIGKQTWSIGVRIMLALLLVAAMRNATKLYMVQEILVVLFVVAVSMMTIFVLVAAFILFQEGIRRTAHWAKVGIIRFAHLSPQGQ